MEHTVVAYVYYLKSQMQKTLACDVKRTGDAERKQPQLRPENEGQKSVFLGEK